MARGGHGSGRSDHWTRGCHSDKSEPEASMDSIAAEKGKDPETQVPPLPPKCERFYSLYSSIRNIGELHNTT